MDGYPTEQPDQQDQQITKKEYKPGRVEALKSYNLNIKFIDRGVVVTVGCKEIAYQTISDFQASFEAYMKDPYTVQQSWLKFFYDLDQIK